MLSIQFLTSSVTLADARGNALAPEAAGQALATTGTATAAAAASGMAVTVQDNARQALNQSLQQALNQWRQQQTALQQQARASKQNASQPLDSSRMEMLKERVKNLRQMLLLVGQDKSGLRAIAMQLKQISAELRQMVANATGQAQPQAMTVSVTAADTGTAGGQAGVDAATTGDEPENTSGDGAALPAASTTADNGGKAAGTADSATGNSDAAAARLPAGSGVASGLSGNMELQTLINSIKAIQQWLRQRQQQTADDGLKKWLDGSSQDMAAISNMLNGGSNSAQGEQSLTLVLADASTAADAASTGASAQA